MAVSVRRATDGSMELGTANPLFDLPLRDTGVLASSHEFAVAADGQRFLVNVATNPRSTISVIVNWVR
jgi:hypothetical protein